jgi:hypothetical protein
MKQLSILLAFGALAAQASTFTIEDVFNQVCATPGDLTCDVVGGNLGYDVQRGEFEFGATSATIRLYFNYGPTNTSLAPFQVAPWSSTVLSLGDLFISGSGFSYGLSLQSRDTPVSGQITGGVLYSINNPNGQLTAFQALGGPTDIYYRPTELVWIRNDGAGSLTSLVNGNVSIVSGGDGVNQTKFIATITLDYAAGSEVSNNLSSGIPTIYFTSATCANDILTNAPEPASLGMMGAGIVLAAWRIRARRKSTPVVA